MGTLFGATFPIIKNRVGEGGQTRGKDVKRINQLLKLGGYFLGALPTDESVWSKQSAEALMNFLAVDGVGPRVPYIDKADQYNRLWKLASAAGVLIPLPTRLISSSATTVFFDHCRKAQYPYGWKDTKTGELHGGGSRIIWGFEGHPAYAVATTTDRCFSSEIPISLNCTSFANLMLAAWNQGSAHWSPYDASQMVGGYDPLGLRYNLHPVHDGKLVHDGYCFDVDGIKQNVQAGRLYYVGLCDNDGYIKHDTVLLNGKFYECNTDQTPAVYSTSIDIRLKKIKYNAGGVRIYGPMPY